LVELILALLEGSLRKLHGFLNILNWIFHVGISPLRLFERLSNLYLVGVFDAQAVLPFMHRLKRGISTNLLSPSFIAALLNLQLEMCDGVLKYVRVTLLLRGMADLFFAVGSHSFYLCRYSII